MQPTVNNSEVTTGRGRPRKTPPETPSSYSSSLSSPLSSGPAAKRVRIDLNPSVMPSTSAPPTVTLGDADERCFVCDTTIVGKKYSLASCMTNGTKVRLVEVLGRLVSDTYMVVVSHGEHICRGCANLLNTLDRLEAEISSVKRIVLNFVERKYRLGDKLQSQLTPTPVVYSKTVPSTLGGAVTTRTTTLPNNQMQTVTTTPKPIVPRQMPPKQSSPVVNAATKTPTPVNPAVRTKAYKITLKDEQILGQSQTILQSAEQQVIGKASTSNQQAPPKNVWMQCNQCQYTTNQRATMLDHLRQHVAARTATPAKPGEGGTKTAVAGPSTVQTPKPAASKPSDTTTINGTPGTSKQMIQVHSTVKPVEGNKPPLMLTIDGKLTPQSGSKQTIILRKTTAPAPGIVSKVLSSPSTSTTIAKSSMSQLFTPNTSIKTVTTPTATTVKVTPKAVVTPVVPTTPKVFSSTSSKATNPEPSLPMFDDL